MRGGRIRFRRCEWRLPLARTSAQSSRKHALLGSRGAVILNLLEQKFTSMIPAGLPAHAAVAHKTGEISTVCHDAGIVYLPEREPYIVAILTEVDPKKDGQRDTVRKISEAVYLAVTGKKAAR